MKEKYFTWTYPFSAVVGQEEAKKALLYVSINPRIGGALLVGEKGTAKSTLVRSLNQITGQVVVNVPLNITEDRLVGTIDFQEVVKRGVKSFDPGLLFKADGQILYIDEVNLLSKQMINILTQVTSLCMNYVEREGLSFSHPVNTSMVASMNPEEGPLKAQFLDKFGLYVELKGEKCLKNREEIIKRRLEFEKDPREFYKKWYKENQKIATKIQKAKLLLPQIVLKNEILAMASDLSSAGNCAGHRGDIILVETAKTIAAFQSRQWVSADDIREAARLVLAHRIREGIALEEQRTEEKESFCKDTQTDLNESEKGREDTEAEGDFEDIDHNGGMKNENKNIKDQVDKIAPINESIKFLEGKTRKKTLVGEGKRSKVKANSKKGRYVKYCLPTGAVEDIALDATLRVAAIHQHGREGGLALNVHGEDIRIKVREKRVGATILFVVDASGSMGAKKRMGAVKGAIFSLLTEAYQKRDKVGLVGFRKNSADVLLDITRSVELAEKSLKIMPTGGKTPLALGLFKAYELFKAEKIKTPGALQYMVLVSDGKANVPFKTDKAFHDALWVAEKIKQEGVKVMVMDTQMGYISYPFAKELAEKMDGEYLKIRGISEKCIENNVKKLIKNEED